MGYDALGGKIGGGGGKTVTPGMSPEGTTAAGPCGLGFRRHFTSFYVLNGVSRVFKMVGKHSLDEEEEEMAATSGTPRARSRSRPVPRLPLLDAYAGPPVSQPPTVSRD